MQSKDLSAKSPSLRRDDPGHVILQAHLVSQLEESKIPVVSHIPRKYDLKQDIHIKKSLVMDPAELYSRAIQAAMPRSLMLRLLWQ